MQGEGENRASSIGANARPRGGAAEEDGVEAPVTGWVTMVGPDGKPTIEPLVW